MRSATQLNKHVISRKIFGVWCFFFQLTFNGVFSCGLFFQCINDFHAFFPDQGFSAFLPGVLLSVFLPAGVFSGEFLKFVGLLSAGGFFPVGLFTFGFFSYNPFKPPFSLVKGNFPNIASDALNSPPPVSAIFFEDPG